MNDMSFFKVHLIKFSDFLRKTDQKLVFSIHKSFFDNQNIFMLFSLSMSTVSSCFDLQSVYNKVFLPLN